MSETTKDDIVQWLKNQQIVFDASGSKDKRPGIAAAEIERLRAEVENRAVRMDADTLNLRSVAKHERHHKGAVELAKIIEYAADQIDALRAENAKLRQSVDILTKQCGEM